MGLNYNINEKVNNKVVSNLNNDKNTQIKLWVFFNNKGENKKINSENKEKFGISQLSYERRVNRSIDLIFDNFDYPIPQLYIDEISECSTNENKIKILHKSKWLNSISIKLNNNNNLGNILSCIANKNYVESIDLVSKFKNKIKFHQNHNNEQNKKSNKSNESFNKMNKMKFQMVENQNNQNDQINPKDYTIGNLKNFYGYSVDTINQTNIFKLHQMGYDGRGITVLICDTGFFKNHEAFQHMKIMDEYNFIDHTKNTTDPLSDNHDSSNDQNAHGTATLSTIGALVPGTLVGPAFGANFLLAKTEIVKGEDSMVEEDNWIAAIEWGESKGACLVTTSLSYLFYDYPQLDGTVSKMSKVANIANSKGMILINSMGNNGFDIFGAPADSDVISVGAVDINGNRAYFSSVGPASDGRVKPDIMGLGRNVMCAFVNSRNHYTSLDGTSFSCPLVAGGVALLMQAHPNWSNNQLKQAILKTGSYSNNPDHLMGFGLFNAYEAFKYSPQSDNCYISGCSGHGICCLNKCKCAPAYYGSNCEYKRLECGDRCQKDFNSICQINSLGKSYKCLYKNDTKQLYLNQYINQIPFC